MTWKHGILLLLAVAVWAGCGDDETGGGEPVTPVEINGALVIPPEWAGTWEVSLTFRDCATDVVYSEEVLTSLICPGDTLVNPFANIFENCSGTRTGNHLSAECQYQNSSGACQVTMDLDFSMDISGNSLSGNGTLQTTTTPACGTFLSAGCQEILISGTRIDTSTSGCTTASPARSLFFR